MNEKEKETVKENQKTTITLVVVGIIYVFIAVNSNGHDLFELMTSFYSNLMKQIGGFLFLIIAIAIAFLYILSVYKVYRNNLSKKIDVSSPLFGYALIFFATFSLIIWSCYCTAPLCLLFIYLTLKDWEGVKEAFHNITVDEEEIEKKYISNINTNLNILKNYEKQFIRDLEREDTNFKIDAFKAQIRKAFFTTKYAISNKSLDKARLFTSDGLYSKLKNEIINLEKNNKNLEYYSLEILDITLLLDDYEQHLDTIIVPIQYQANYSYRSKLLNNADNPEKINETNLEIWYLVRKKGVKTKSSAGLLTNCCPCCKTNIDKCFSYKCPSCGADLNSGENDWILTDIYKYNKSLEYDDFIHDIEDNYKNLDSINYNEILKYDPHFSFINIKDKIKYMFWNLVEGFKTENKTIIRNLSTNKFYKHIFDSLFKDIIKKNNGIELHSVNIEGMYNENGQDYLVCVVSWESKQLDNVFNHNKSINNTLFVLTRSDKIKTDSEPLFCSNYCPNCGAKQVSQKNNCYKCDHPLNDINKIWLLDEIINSYNIKHGKYISKIKNSGITAKFKANSKKLSYATPKNTIVNKKEDIENLVDLIYEKTTSSSSNKEITSFISINNNESLQEKQVTKEIFETPIKTEDSSINIPSEGKEIIDTPVKAEDTSINIHSEEKEIIDTSIKAKDSSISIPSEKIIIEDENKAESSKINIQLTEPDISLAKTSNLEKINKVEIKKVEIPNNLLGSTSLKVGSNIEIKPVSSEENLTINSLSAPKVNIEKTETITNIEEPKQVESTPQIQENENSSLLSSPSNSISLLGRIDISSSNLSLSKSLSSSSLLSSSLDIKPLSVTPSDKKD